MNIIRSGMIFILMGLVFENENDLFLVIGVGKGWLGRSSFYYSRVHFKVKFIGLPLFQCLYNQKQQEDSRMGGRRYLVRDVWHDM